MEAIVEVGKAVDVLILPLELGLPLGGPEQLHVFREVSEDFWRGITALVERAEGEGVQAAGAFAQALAREDPGEDGVLGEVVLGTPAVVVQRHQVLEVRDSPLAPPIGQLSLLDDLPWVQGVVEPQVFALQPPQLQQLLGEVVSLLGGVELEEVGVVLDHEDLEAALEADEPPPLNVPDALEVDPLAELLASCVLSEEEQVVQVLDVWLVMILGLLFEWVQIGEY